MSNIKIDLSYTNITTKVPGVSTFTYKDIGTSNLKLVYGKNEKNQQTISLYDSNTSNTDLNAIKAALKNIFSFLPGQQILDPQFGCTLYQYIYEPMTQMTEFNIRRTIKQTILKYQPRISLTELLIQKNDQKLQYQITMKYNVPKLGVSSAQILTMSMSDGITFA